MGHPCTEGQRVFRIFAYKASIVSSLLSLLAQLDLGRKWHATIVDMTKVCMAASLQPQTCCR